MTDQEFYDLIYSENREEDLKKFIPTDFTNDQLYLLLLIIENDHSVLRLMCELVDRMYLKINALEDNWEKTEHALKKLKKEVNEEIKPGRNKDVYMYMGRVLDDDYIVYLVDNNYYTIPELEREVNARKNVIRNRYNREKHRQIEEEKKRKEQEKKEKSITTQ